MKDQSWKVLVLGPNQSGKSTLLTALTNLEGLILSGLFYGTSRFWSYTESINPMEKPICFTEFARFGDDRAKLFDNIKQLKEHIEASY